MISWQHRKEVLKELDKESCIRFALKAAKLVQHLSEDYRVSEAIEAVENWLANPCAENAVTTCTGAGAAYTTTTAAYITANATYAAADYTARATADAADAYVAYTTRAADAAAKADPNVKPILVSYLRELYQQVP